MISKDTKVQRIIAFMHDLSQHIANSEKFSFTNKTVQYKLNWCTNALCIRGILIQHSIIYTIGNWKLAFTPVAAEFKMRDLAIHICQLIDEDKTTYLDAIINDADVNKVDEKPVDYEEIAHLYQEGKSDHNGHVSPELNLKTLLMLILMFLVLNVAR